MQLGLKLLVPLALPVASQSYNWIQNPANGHHYALTAPTSWTAAEAEAQRLGGHLVTIRSQAESDWLLQVFPGQDFWIGMSDAAQEGTWEWSSGEPVVYTRWCGGEPSNGGAGEDYAHLFWNLNGTVRCRGDWNDICPNSCRSFPGVVEIVPPTAAYSTYRQSCPSSVGVPQLTNQTLPRIGQPLDLVITGMGPFKIGYLLFGFTDQRWGVNSLPLDLTAFGAPSCFMHVDPLVAFVAPTDAAGVARISWRVWPDPAYLGVVFFNQFVTLDDAPPGRPLRITTTNAGRGVVGF